MPSVAEAMGQTAHLFPPLQDAIEELASDQDVVFIAYQRMVLPLDGFVFWLRSGVFKARGSLHYQVARQMREDESLTIDRVVFTSESEITQFNQIAPQQLFVGAFQTSGGGSFRFAFSQRGPLFKEADIFHYAGESVWPALASQLIDSPTQITDATLVVSNSLPSWLSLASYAPIWLAPANPGIALYPSFLVPDNTPAPYGTVHIEPAGTRALQSVPLLDPNTYHAQLAADRVRVTLYGLTNDQALAWHDTAIQYIRDTSNIGLMSMPVMRDDKRPQAEIDAIAMKKTIDFEVSYLQSAQFNIARQLIEQASAAFIVAEERFVAADIIFGQTTYGAATF